METYLGETLTSETTSEAASIVNLPKRPKKDINNFTKQNEGDQGFWEKILHIMPAKRNEGTSINDVMQVDGGGL